MRSLSYTIHVIQFFVFVFVVVNYQCEKINQAACDLAKGVALEGGAIFAGSICQTAGAYASGAGKEAVQKQFQDQIAIFLKNDVELLIAEVSEFS